jgi:YD repeat-containing protein
MGAGKWSAWAGVSAAVTGYWPGQIAEFAFYRSQLSDAQVSTQFAARPKSSGSPVRTVTITDPGTNPIKYVYDVATGRKVTEIDALGNDAQFGYDTGGFVRTVTDPNDNVTTTEQDVRGNTISSKTCQTYSTQKCSTVFFTYYPDATTKVLAPAPRNDVMLNDARRSLRDCDGQHVQDRIRVRHIRKPDHGD